MRPALDDGAGISSPLLKIEARYTLHMKTSRRDFLAVSALAPVAGRLMAASAPAFRFPTAARERIAVASYPFRAFLDSPRNRGRNPQGPLMALKEFPAMVVERFQIPNVELLGEHITSAEPAYLEQLRAAVKSAGSHIVDIPTGVGGSVYDADSARRATAVGNAKKWVDTAVALECPSLRVHLQGARGAAPAGACFRSAPAPGCPRENRENSPPAW